MTITLDLPQELERELEVEASLLGLSVAEYVLHLLATGPRYTHGSAAGTAPQTGAELVTYWRSAGVIGTRPDIVDSQEHARTLRQQAERRSRI